MSFMGYERPWRRKEIERTRRQHEAQGAAFRERWGLARREPEQGSGMALPRYEDTSRGMFTVPVTGSFNDQVNPYSFYVPNTYNYTWNATGSAVSVPVSGMIVVSTGDENATAKVRDAKAEREPTLREIWRD